MSMQPNQSPRIYHGNLTSQELARILLAAFNRGNLRAQQLDDRGQVIVQIATAGTSRTGGQTALTVLIRPVEDGVAVQIGKQTWLGVAASLGQSALGALRNPWSLLDRLDDIATDIDNLKLSEQVWGVIEKAAQTAGATTELSARLRRMECEYCSVANPVDEGTCIACGAPLGGLQPRTCRKCGFVVRKHEAVCPNCGQRLSS